MRCFTIHRRNVKLYKCTVLFYFCMLILFVSHDIDAHIAGTAMSAHICKIYKETFVSSLFPNNISQLEMNHRHSPYFETNNILYKNKKLGNLVILREEVFISSCFAVNRSSRTGMKTRHKS